MAKMATITVDVTGLDVVKKLATCARLLAEALDAAVTERALSAHKFDIERWQQTCDLVERAQQSWADFLSEVDE